jgi:SAM-dependent methyltransferase
MLDRLALPAAPPERGREVEVDSGLLVCGSCARWFPIERTIPELLPDHLRDEAREAGLFATAIQGAPEEFQHALAAFRPSSGAQSDPGAHYKKAEIGISARIDDPVFFGPGYTSPFNPWNSAFTTYLIALFGTVAPLLDLDRGDVVLDSGCGYAWTTEWLFRSGYDAIGVDICRTYLDIAVTRMGAIRPHLVVGDVENLPFLDGIAHAVLAYESFHHIPDRSRALVGYYRVLGPAGAVVLAEPGAAHEQAAVSVEAMVKFGILERGMELADVIGYAAGTGFNPPEQILILRTTSAELGSRLDETFARRHSVAEGNLFRMTKGRPRPFHMTTQPGLSSRRRTRLGRGLERVRSVLKLGAR